jgi:hypothetical protein
MSEWNDGGKTYKLIRPNGGGRNGFSFGESRPDPTGLSVLGTIEIEIATRPERLEVIVTTVQII